jgi:hypothetical protein
MAVLSVRKVVHPSFDGVRWLVSCATCAVRRAAWSTICDDEIDVLLIVRFHRCLLIPAGVRSATELSV